MQAVRAGRVVALAPDLVFAETAQALIRYVRSGWFSIERSARITRNVVRLPLEVTPVRDLVPAAHALALARGLTVYDACYLALALATDAVLVTADECLAAAAEESALLPHALPPG
jgi:predicted nucleic acid-binding protein